MAEIEGAGTVQGFLARAIEKGRKSSDASARVQQKKAEAKRQAEKQEARPKAPRASGDRDFDRAREALLKRTRASRPRPKREASGGRRVDTLRQKTDAQAREELLKLASQLGMTPEQAADILLGAKT